MKSKRIVLLIFLLFLLVGIYACSSADDLFDSGVFAEDALSEPTAPSTAVTETVLEFEPEPEIQTLIVVVDSMRLARGSTFEPRVIIYPSDATDKTFTLTSDDTSVIRRRSGRWTAVGDGTTTLIATAPNGVTGFTTITVYVAVEDIVLDLPKLVLHHGESATLNPSLAPYDVTDTTITFKSRDENIVTVSEEGVITSHSRGSTEIILSAEDVEKIVEITIIEPVTTIRVTSDRRSYQVGDEGQFFIRVSPEGASDAALTVTMSGDEIALTGDNNFIANFPGEVTITVTAANGVEGSHVISVIDLELFAEEVFRLTNVERARAGLAPFFTSQPLDAAAMVRAVEIVEVFSHTRPDGRDCFTAFAENDVVYLTAGENLAAGHRHPADVVRGWMDSPSHRENILNPAFGRLGIGVYMDENGRLYWTQAFTD